MIAIQKNDIPPGEGKYFPGELGKTHGVAAHRRQDGSFVILSADCPHRHCNVDWSAEKKRWECPCHGSVFTAEGKLVQGPATRDLTELSPADKGETLEVEPI